MFFSLYSINSGFLAAVNHWLIESEKLDHCFIKKTDINCPVLVIKEKPETIGAHFLPCYTLEQAIEVAVIAVPVLDLDRIMESMYDHTWGDEIKDMDDDTDDIIVAEEIIYRIYKYMRERVVVEILPTKEFTLRQQVLRAKKSNYGGAS